MKNLFLHRSGKWYFRQYIPVDLRKLQIRDPNRAHPSALMVITAQKSASTL